MRKIIIEAYQVTQNGQSELYPMQEALAEALFHPAVKINALGLLKRDDLARKILGCGEGSVLLEDAEYSMLKDAVDKIDSYTRNDVEFVRRVLEAETVEVKEKE